MATPDVDPWVLLRALWPGAATRPGCVTVTLLPSRRSVHFPVAALPDMGDEDADELRELAGADQHVYYGVASRVPDLPESRRGGKRDLLELPAFVLDVDVDAPGKHAASAETSAKKLPPDEAAAMGILAAVESPSCVVQSGYGFHAYWFLDDALPLTSDGERIRAKKLYKAWVEPAHRAAREMGYHLDDTAGIERVWRLPGFENRK